MKRWLVSAVMLLLGQRRQGPRLDEEGRIVAPGSPEPRAELVVALLLFAAAVCAAGFIAAYAIGSLAHRTQYLGLGLGLSFACLAVSCAVAAKRLVVTEELEEEYSPPENVADQEAIAEIVDESGSRFTRKRLIKVAAGAAGGTLGAALIVPAASLGPILDTSAFYETPWRRGRRLVDEAGRPFRAADVEEKAFYTAFPEGAEREDFGAPLVVVRLKPAQLHLPAGRKDWSPGGILAFSKICTHAGCAINLYRTPLFPQASPRSALVCPCHYSTFDPATGGEVIYGPAGRALSQLPLMVDTRGTLRAAGTFSGPVGPSWWGVRMKEARARR